MKTAICKNEWCKGTFEYKDSEDRPKHCPKCNLLNYELSEGITWDTHVYTEPLDFGPQEMTYKVTTYK